MDHPPNGLFQKKRESQFGNNLFVGVEGEKQGEGRTPLFFHNRVVLGKDKGG